MKALTHTFVVQTQGEFVVALKGVMNQKMPYYGLHDPRHLVALARNRMYVNLMNIETGELVLIVPTWLNG